MAIDQKRLDEILSHVGDMGLKRRVQAIIEYLDIQPGDVVLDCGCGDGFYLGVLSELFDCKIYGLDHDWNLLIAASTRGPKEKLLVMDGDILRLPFKGGVFDKIILSEVLEHLPDDHGALLEIRRVLKQSGTFAITVPNHNYPLFWDPLNKIREALGLGHFSKDNGLLGGIWAMHLRLYYPDQLRAVVEKAGFRVSVMKGLVHYCLPFTHNILYIGKQIVFRYVPLPTSIRDSMDKFAWKSNRGTVLNPVSWLQKLINAIDLLDNSINANNLGESWMCIFAGAEKT